jgi:hypothetical protein
LPPETRDSAVSVARNRLVSPKNAAPVSALGKRFPGTNSLC